MRQTNVRGNLSLRGFRKLRTGAIVATGVILLGLGFLAPTVSANEQDGVWVARTVAEVKADLQKEGDLFKYVIKWGDTLSVISEASNIPVDVLQEMNQASGKNLFLPHNELYFTEAETVSDTVTKHKIVIKESGASGEVRTYEVLIKKDQETKALTFELTDVTEKVEKMAVNYSPVYQPVSAPIVESAEESVEELAPVSPVVTSPEVKEETEAPVVPKAEEAATTPAPKSEEKPATPAPKAEDPATPALKSEDPAVPAPKAEEPASTTPKAEEPVSPAPKAEDPATPAPKEEKPATPAPKEEKPVTPAPKADEPTAGTTPKADEPAAGTTPKADEPVVTTPKADEPATPAPKAEEPAAPAPKVEEPVTPAPKAEEPATPAPKAKEPVSSAPKVEEPATPAPKAEEPAVGTTPKAEEPAAGTTPKSEESTAPAPKAEEAATTPAPKVEEPATPAPKSDEPAVPAPKVEEPAAGTTPKSDEPAAGTTPKSEEEPAAGTMPKAEEPAAGTMPKAEESAAGTTPKAEESAAGTTPKAEEPAAGTTPKSEAPAAGTTPKAEEPATSNPAPAPKDEKLEEAKKDGKDAIEKIAASKLSEIEKVKDEAEKAKLEAKLKELKEAGLEAINNAKNHDAAVDAADEYQTKIDEINVPGEELPAPNYNKDNLTNGRNEGTTINDGSTAIGHGSGEAPTQPASEERSTSTASPTQPSSTSERASSFRNAPSVQARARRVVRSTSEPDGTVNISYNFAGMPDIHGFLSDPGENNTVTIPAGTSEAQAKELVKEKIQAKIKDLAARGYHVKNDIIFEQDTTVKNYNYVVTFTKEATGTSGFRMAPAVQPRASRNRRSLEQPAPQKVKVNVFYNFDQMKDIAGFLGDINGTPLEVAEGSTNEQVKAAVKNQVDAKKEELRKRGYTFKEDYVYQANGKDYNYVVTFTKEATGTSGFRMAPAVQPRASRNRRSLEQPAPQKVKVNVFYNFDQMKDIAGFLGDINGTSLEIAEGLSNEEVKVAVKKQVEAKKEELSKRGYTFKEDYVYQSNGKDYNYVVIFSKATK